MAPLQGNNLYRAIISKEIEKRDRYFILKENCIKSFLSGVLPMRSRFRRNRKGNQIAELAPAIFIILVVFLSILFAIAGYLMTDPILTLMGAEKAIFADAESYLRISFWGIIFLFGYFVFQSLMRGIGEVRTPLYIVTGTVLLNLFLDPMFILGFGPIPAYGVSGAAIATVSTQGLATVVGFSILFSGRYGIHIRPENFRIDLGVMKKMLALGIPASIQQSTRALNFLVMTILVASFGTLAVASYGIGFRVLSFIIIPALGLMMANSTLVGQNMGANKIERAVKTSFFSAIFAFVGLTVVGIVLFIFAHQIAAAFLPGETEVIEASALFIRIMALSFGFLGIQRVLGGTLQGAGSPMTAMALSLTTSWVFNFPLAYVLSKHTSLGMAGIWWSFPISNVLGALITYIVYARGTWKNKRLTEDTDLGTEVARETAIEDNL